MEAKLRRDIRFLKAYAIISSLLLALIALSNISRADHKERFDELDVERINIVDKNGKLRLVVSNKDRFPDPIIDGKTYPMRQGAKTAGMIFYNDNGDECGGLSFNGQERDGRRQAGAGLLFDQFNQDQTIGITYGDSDGRRSAGLNVWDRPDTRIGDMIEKLQALQKMPDGPDKTQALQRFRETSGVAQRVFVGKTRDKAAIVALSDPQGRPRIQLIVDNQGAARIEFMDEKGSVSHQFPAPASDTGLKKSKS
jgi:hypothetical protein